MHTGFQLSCPNHWLFKVLCHKTKQSHSVQVSSQERHYSHYQYLVPGNFFNDRGVLIFGEEE
jgi:hypothetical protein